ncbi:phage tail protein [Streptomyces californicus]
MKIARWLNETIRRVEPKDGEIVALRPDLQPDHQLAGSRNRSGPLAGPVLRPGQLPAAIETLEIAHEGLEPS